jgi:hypothetical protein
MTHALVVEAQRAGAPPDMQARIEAAAERLEGALAAALGVSDPDRAREVLPAVLRALYVELGPFYGGGLLAGTTWRDEQHRRLFAHASRLFGAEAARVIQPPPHDRLGPAAAGRRGA